MQVRVFAAKDMATGLKMVKEALGPNALILSTRTVRNGSFGVLGKPTLEITAAIENDAAVEPPSLQRQTYSSPSQREIVSSPSQREIVSSPRQRQTLETPRTEALQRPGNYRTTADDLRYEDLWAPPEAEPAPSPRPHAELAAQNIQSELAELRNLVSGLTQRLSDLDTPAAPRPTPTRTMDSAATANSPLEPVVGYLSGFGINRETAQVVARFTRDTLNRSVTNRQDGQNPAPNQVLKNAIARLFNTEPLFDRPSAQQRRIALIGPTGVGKTTTLAKIAAHYLSRIGGRLGLITIDTYRIAAVEQLKVYSEIMRLPLEVVINPQEFQQALEKFSDRDLILIDTAGRSPRNELDIQELASFLQRDFDIENHLLLSATSRERELEETIRRFAVLPIRNFIFSKLDECDQLGVLLNIHYTNDTPISFLTNGQRVPEDLLMPTSMDIADLIIKDQGNLHDE